MIAFPPHSEPAQPSDDNAPALGTEAWEQIAELIRARQPIEAGLKTVARELPFSRLRRQLLRLAVELERGKSLTELSQSRRIPADLRELLKAGVETGQLGTLLQDYVDDALQAQDLRWQIRFFTFYALVLVTVALIVNAFVVTMVGGISAKIMNDFGTVPTVPVFSSQVANFIAWIAAALPLLLLTLAWLISSILPIRMWSLFYRIPLLGGIYRWQAFSRGARILALLIRAQIPLPRSFEIAGNSVRHPLASHAFLKMQSKIEQGTPLDDAALSVTTLPPSLREVFAQLQDSSSLPEMLRGLAELYLNRSRELIRWFLAFWEPAVLFICGSMILFFYTGIAVNLVKLLQALS